AVLPDHPADHRADGRGRLRAQPVQPGRRRPIAAGVTFTAGARAGAEFSRPRQAWNTAGLDYLWATARRQAVSVPAPLHYVTRLRGLLLGNRLTVDPRTLTPLVLVRIQVPQPCTFQQNGHSLSAGECRVFSVV